MLLAMKNKTCRFVLHATPAAAKLVQPATLHPLKAEAEFKP